MATETVIDWDDPCAAYKIVRDRYYKILSGGGVQRIQFADRSVQYFGTGDVDALLTLMQRLETECGQKSGSPKRFAISAGGGVR